MSNMREKAREIKAAGEAERGNFEPHGVPKRVYSYWLENSVSNKADAIGSGQRRENFCHFWRVVAIWAPLLWLGLEVVFTKTFAVVLGLASLVALVWLLTVSPTVLIGLGLILTAVAAVAAVFGLFYLIDQYYPESWIPATKKVLTGLLIVAIAAGLIGLLVAAVIDFGWIVLAYIAGFIAGTVALIFGVATLSTFIEGRRALARKKHSDYLDSLSYEEYLAYREQKNAPREPGKISKFFSGVGDFLVLAAQVVRVKKWKICPMVDIND